MSDTPEYITARPVTLEEVQEWATAEVTPEPLFVPLDIPAIEKQLDDIITDIGSHYWNNDQVFMEDREQFAKEIKVLFGLENKETEQ